MPILEKTGKLTNERMPRFIVFLVNVAVGVGMMAREEDAGEIAYEPVQLRERTEMSSGLACLYVWYVNKGGEELHYHFFAAGNLKGHSMVKIERVGEDSYEVMSSNSRLILAYLSSPFHLPIDDDQASITGAERHSTGDAPPQEVEDEESHRQPSTA